MVAKSSVAPSQGTMLAMICPEVPPSLVPTGTTVGWRRPALVLAAVLVAVVGIARLGAPDHPPVPSLPVALPTEAALVPPTLPPIYAPSAVPSGARLVIGRITGAMRRSADGLTYADGIPTGISGQSVYRVRDALLVPVGYTLLVGGWYLRRDCAPTLPFFRCPSPTLSDVPLVSSSTGDVATTFVAIDTHLSRSGARVVLAMVEPDPGCSIRNGGACLPRLRVLQQVWSGSPIG